MLAVMIVSSLSKKKSIYRCDMVLDCIAYACAKSLQPCPALCDPMDCSPPGSSDNGILQARILEWVAMPPSRAPSWPRNRTHISYVFCIGWHVFFLPLAPPGSPLGCTVRPPTPAKYVQILPFSTCDYGLITKKVIHRGNEVLVRACWIQGGS